jgi:RNAse (barnase) inhibitor barstar
MNIVDIDSRQINNWNSFHTVFAEIFQSPEYNGRNMNPLIDCIDEFITASTVINLGDCRKLRITEPEIIQALLESNVFVNYRRIKADETSTRLVSMFT